MCHVMIKYQMSLINIIVKSQVHAYLVRKTSETHRCGQQRSFSLRISQNIAASSVKRSVEMLPPDSGECAGGVGGEQHGGCPKVSWIFLT